MAKVGYKGTSTEPQPGPGTTSPSRSWDYKDGKIDPKTRKPTYTRLGNLMGVVDSLTGPDGRLPCLVATCQAEASRPSWTASWRTKQADAFQTAYKSVDD